MSNILFMDLSSSCSGWLTASNDEATGTILLDRCGVRWFKSDAPNGLKYKEIKDFVLDQGVKLMGVTMVVPELYTPNLKFRNGSLVVPSMIGVVEAACYEVVPPLKFEAVPPQTWRKNLGIKKDKTLEPSFAWKIPTKDKIHALLGKELPAQIISNVNGKSRNTTFDLYDAIALGLGYFMGPKYNSTKIIMGPNFLERFGV